MSWIGKKMTATRKQCKGMPEMCKSEEAERQSNRVLEESLRPLAPLPLRSFHLLPQGKSMVNIRTLIEKIY